MHLDPYSLIPVAYQAALQVVASPVLAHEASERAVHQLAVALVDGDIPHSPKAWLRVVARRSACALLRSDWARTTGMDVGEVASRPRRSYRSEARISWMRDKLEPTLTPRQRQALDAALTCNTTRAAARTCGMEPRDFRRSLTSISQRARQLLARDPATMRRLGPDAEAEGHETPGYEVGRAV